jgi:excisionase family DNA binding protein
MEKLWTTSEVAQFLGITEHDVTHLVKRGQLTAYKLGGRFLRFRPEQVNEIKNSIKLEPATALAAPATRDNVVEKIRDFVYFYDFYLVSALLLVVFVLYIFKTGS